MLVNSKKTIKEAHFDIDFEDTIKNDSDKDIDYDDETRDYDDNYEDEYENGSAYDDEYGEGEESDYGYEEYDEFEEYEKNNDYRGLSKVLAEREKAIRIKEENAKIQTDEIIKNASKKAENMINAAQKQADLLIENATKQATDEGYNDGYQKGKKDAEKLKDKFRVELEEKKEELLVEQRVFEKDLMDRIALVLEKITGIIVEEHKEVICHIINREFMDIERSDNYLIKVSQRDYEYVNSKKQHLQGYIREDAALEIVQTDTLDENRCIIETDNSVIDCSLDTQLKNLITDLKLLAKV